MISVIIPTHNRGYIIKKSIDSVLSQTYKNIELIVVDDNSTDNTEQIIKEINDSRLIYIKLNKNVGANAARNIGIKKAKGEFIAFQDSDDEWIDSKLEIQLKELKEKNFDIVCCSFWQNDYDTTQIFPNMKVESEDLLHRILLENFMSTQTIMGYRKCFLQECFDEDMPRFQDWELSIRLVKTFNVGFIDIPLVNVYIQKNSISRNNKRAVIALEKILNKYEKDIIKYNLKSYYYRKIVAYASMADYDSDKINNYAKQLFLCNRFNVSNILIYLLSKLHILKVLYKIKYSI